VRQFTGKVYTYYGVAIDELGGKYKAVIKQKYSRQEEKSYITDDYQEAVEWLLSYPSNMSLKLDPETSNISLSFLGEGV